MLASRWAWYLLQVCFHSGTLWRRVRHSNRTTRTRRMSIAEPLAALFRRCPTIESDAPEEFSLLAPLCSYASEADRATGAAAVHPQTLSHALSRIAARRPAFTLAMATCFRTTSLLRLASSIVESHIQDPPEDEQETAALCVALIALLELAPHISK